MHVVRPDADRINLILVLNHVPTVNHSMVNSGLFDSADPNRNGKTRCTQVEDAVPLDVATSNSTAAANGGGGGNSKLPSDEQAIGPTPTKTTEMSATNNNNNSSSSSSGASPAIGLDKSKQQPSRKLLCLYCERTFVSANLRQKHVERVHSVKSNRRVSARRPNQFSATPCAHCDKLNATEYTLSHLFQHLVHEHSAKYFGCLACEERFLSPTHLADHNRVSHATVSVEPRVQFDSSSTSTTANLSPKITRSKLRSKMANSNQSASLEADKQKKQKSKFKERKKKIGVKSSKIATKRSKRLQQQQQQQQQHQQQVKEPQEQTTQRRRQERKVAGKQEQSSSTCVNPYPEFDSFFRVKKITDHSIDNLKISSLTFDDVFDKAFFNRIVCNIEENLLHHIDGKLFKNKESETRISHFEKVASQAGPELQNCNAENFGCDISLNAITPASSLSLNSQFGEDFETQIEYGAKPSKKRPQIKKDEVHYKYFTRRKYQASILQQKENRDLSKLDIRTQMVVKERQQRLVNKKKSVKEMQDYTSGMEYRNKIRREELNRILDRRGPFEDLKEEASKKAAFDKLNSSSPDSDISEEAFTDVREVINDLLMDVFEAVEIYEEPTSFEEFFSKEIDVREIPAYLDLRRRTSTTQEEIDRSDKIALICSSQETDENFELPTNTVRAKNEQVELTGEWARTRMYICAACGGKFANVRYMMDHKAVYHQNVWVQHYEFVGNQSELYRHLSIPGLGKVGVVERTVPCKQWKKSDARNCTKCDKRCNTLGELHRHMLECGEDWTWLLARKKCKYRPYGARSRRKRRGFEPPKPPTKPKTEPAEKKSNSKKTVDGPRQRPSDAETIQRMLANLPAKRSRRSIMSLTDAVFKSRKNTRKPTPSNAPSSKPQKEQSNSKQYRPKRAVRNLNKVLSSRILDLNASMLVKRKMKALRSQRPSQEGDSENKRTESTTTTADKETKTADEAVKTRNNSKRLLTSRLSLKNFFPIRKKGSSKLLGKTSEADKLSTGDLQENETDSKKLKYLENFQNVKKSKRGGLKGFVRGLSLRKRNCKDEECAATTTTVVAPESQKKNTRLKAKQSEWEATESTKKRKLQRSFRNVINKVKKLKLETEPTAFLEKVPSQAAEESALPERAAALVEPKDDNTAGKQDPARTVDSLTTDSTENPTVPETIFNLENSEEKSLQAKGELDFDQKPVNGSKLVPVVVDTTVKPKSASQMSPNVKGKIRKPSRGLNDCIAMLTSMLQKKEEKHSSVESLSSAGSNGGEVLASAENATAVLEPSSTSTLVSEEIALDLSKKSVSTPNLNLPPLVDKTEAMITTAALTAWSSVDDVIQQVVQNSIDATVVLPKKPYGYMARSNLDDTIDFVVNSSLNWFESSNPKTEQKKHKRKRHSNDNLITNIIFGKDKLIIAPSSDPARDLTDPLIARIKENEYKNSLERSNLQDVQSIVVSVQPLEEQAKVQPIINELKDTKLEIHLPPPPLKTNLDDCEMHQEIPTKELDNGATLTVSTNLELHNEQEPIQLETKTIEITEKLEDDLSTKADSLAPVEDSVKDDPVETLTTDSLKENVENVISKTSTVLNEMNNLEGDYKTPLLKKKKGKKLTKRQASKLKKTNSMDVLSESNVQVATDATSTFKNADLPTDATTKVPVETIGKIACQRTRRKSKSLRKSDKIDNDLFKDFSLVIKKKTKRIPPTSIVDDSVRDDSLEGDADKFKRKSPEEKAEEPPTNPILNDSLEEMDMEIEEIPISANIIERRQDPEVFPYNFKPIIQAADLRNFAKPDKECNAIAFQEFNCVQSSFTEEFIKPVPTDIIVASVIDDPIRHPIIDKPESWLQQSNSERSSSEEAKDETLIQVAVASSELTHNVGDELVLSIDAKTDSDETLALEKPNGIVKAPELDDTNLKVDSLQLDALEDVPGSDKELPIDQLINDSGFIDKPLEKSSSPKKNIKKAKKNTNKKHCKSVKVSECELAIGEEIQHSENHLNGESKLLELENCKNKKQLDTATSESLLITEDIPEVTTKARRPRKIINYNEDNLEKLALEQVRSQKSTVAKKKTKRSHSSLESDRSENENVTKKHAFVPTELNLTSYNNKGIHNMPNLFVDIHDTDQIDKQIMDKCNCIDKEFEGLEIPSTMNTQEAVKDIFEFSEETNHTESEVLMLPKRKVQIEHLPSDALDGKIEQFDELPDKIGDAKAIEYSLNQVHNTTEEVINEAPEPTMEDGRATPVVNEASEPTLEDSRTKSENILTIDLSQDTEEILLETKSLPNRITDNEQVIVEPERQTQLAKINIKNLLLSSLVVPPEIHANAISRCKKSPKIRGKKHKMRRKDDLDLYEDTINKPNDAKSLLNISTIKDVLSSFTNAQEQKHVFCEIQPLSEIISNSEMDIAPVLDEIDKSLESEDIYDFHENTPQNEKVVVNLDVKHDNNKPKIKKTIPDITTYSEEFLDKDNNSTINVLDSEQNGTDRNDSAISTNSNDGLELRRSRRRESRKVASYNENDLIDPLIDALEHRRNKVLKNRSSDKSAKSKALEEPLDTSVPQQLDRVQLETGKSQDPDKIYEFTEENPEHGDELPSKNKKKSSSESGENPNKSNYCDICKRSFIRMENLVKHKMTLTHISKLSELEAKEAEERSRLESEREDINIADILQQPDRSQADSDERQDEEDGTSSLQNSHSLKLVDIISDVLNKPVLNNYSPDNGKEKDDKRYKSLGERKSFDSEHALSPLPPPYLPPSITQSRMLESQINLLENIISNNLDNIPPTKCDEKDTSNYIDDISSCSSDSNKFTIDNSSTAFVKPTQYEEISEDSINGKLYEDAKQRKTLNRDEELFLECCSLLKSGSEMSNSNYAKKTNCTTAKPFREAIEPDFMETKNIMMVQQAEEAQEYSDNSRTPTPLGDTYDDEASNSNTISSNWHLQSEKSLDKNCSYTFEQMKSKEAAGMSFEDVLKNQYENVHKPIDKSLPSYLEKATWTEDRKTDSDSSSNNKKIVTKGAKKVYEALKVSIPTDDLNLDILSARKLDDNPDPVRAKSRKSKPVKKSQVGSNLLFKVNKKKASPPPIVNRPVQEDVYSFEEEETTRGSSDDHFVKPKEMKKPSTFISSDNDSLGYADSIGADAKSVSSLSSFSAASATKPETAPENITKKKYKIMGRIFKNAAKSKLDDVEDEFRNIPEIPEMDNLELVENYVRSCPSPLPPPPPLDEDVLVPKKPKMTEEEMNMLFDQLLGKDVNDKSPAPQAAAVPSVVNKSKRSAEAKSSSAELRKKSGKIQTKNRKRHRPIDSSDDEFNINKSSKKRSGKKSNQEDSGINLELELKECIGVASRKSQRTCTSGKQNILVEYWSSDEEAFEAMLEHYKLPPRPDEEARNTVEKPPNKVKSKKPPPSSATLPPPNPIQQQLLPPASVKKPKTNNNHNNNNNTEKVKGASSSSVNRRKRVAASPLYHWSSSSEDESQSLIEVKPIREEDDEDRPVQHGWIVGDSPKKLVTMLALTKGKKTDFDSVKEQGKKRSSSAVS